MTLDDLIGIFHQCGVNDGVDLSGDILDTRLADLGYDSLAQFHIHTLVEELTGVTLGEGEFEDLQTPRSILLRVGSIEKAA
jgi:act minimal PKS acyl carrier protein